MNRPFSILISCVVCMSATALAAMSVDDVIKMSKAGMGEDVIVAQLATTNAKFDLSVDELIMLKGAGVSDKVIKAMVSGSATVTQLPPQPPAPTKLELGVYGKKEGAWIALEPEIVSIKQSSGFKIYTGGIDTNGYLGGASSKTTLKTPLEIMLVTSEGVSANEYQLVRLRPSSKNNNREFRVGRAGFGGGKAGVDRDKIAFDFKKLGPGEFTISLPSSVVAGEYAFLPPMASGGGSFGGQIASGGKAYTFRVLE